VFADYANHYSANPLLSSEAAAAGYREWAMKTPLRDSLVLSVDGSPAGIATLDRTSDHVEILLAGVVPELRGRGMYPHLLQGVEDDAMSSDVERVVISTQAHNTVVQRAWARYGFVPLTTFITVHAVKRALWDAAFIT
jgi:ribosomal protein S18 acetylase RimI-like enzyme